MRPYTPDALPLASLDWAALVPLIGKTNAALARYDGLLQSVPNPEVLLAPLATQEAVLSSRIEGTQATLEDVLTYEARGKAPAPLAADVQEVLNYRDALAHGLKTLEKRPFGLNLLRSMHAVLMQGVRGQNKAPGELRRIQNWIGAPGSTLETATYVPPSPEQVLPALSALEHYYHSDEKDPIVQLAIIHAQFEIIHPFLDGNGRIGRLIIPLFLVDKGLLTQPMFYISAYFEADRRAYYNGLNGITQAGDWQGWIAFFLGAVQTQAQQGSEQVRAILHLYDTMKTQIVEQTRSQYALYVLDFIFARPLFSSSDFVDGTPISKRTAFRLLRLLVTAGTLRETEPARGARPAMFAFPALLSITK